MGAQQSSAPPAMPEEERRALAAECEAKFKAYMACVDRHQQGPTKGLRLDDCEEESAAYRACNKKLPKRAPR